MEGRCFHARQIVRTGFISGRKAELSDNFLHLPVFTGVHAGYPVETVGGQAHIGQMRVQAAPVICRKEYVHGKPEQPGQAYPHIAGVHGVFGDAGIKERFSDFTGNGFAVGNVHDMYRAVVHGVSQQQTAEVIPFGIAIDADAGDVLAAVGLYIYK